MIEQYSFHSIISKIFIAHFQEYISEASLSEEDAAEALLLFSSLPDHGSDIGNWTEHNEARLNRSVSWAKTAVPLAVDTLLIFFSSFVRESHII